MLLLSVLVGVWPLVEGGAGGAFITGSKFETGEGRRTRCIVGGEQHQNVHLFEQE